MSDEIFHDLPAPPLHPDVREEIADKWLSSADQNQGGPVNIMAILSVAGITISELPVAKMGDNAAYARPQVKTIFVRPDFRSECLRKNPNALFAIAHEFGHCALHRGPLAKPLKVSGNVSPTWIKQAGGQEDQAWDLARAIMLPRAFVYDTDEVADITQRLNAPLHHAKIRLAQLRFERRKKIQSILTLPDTVKSLWDSARADPDHDPNYYRISSKGSLVEINSYNRFDLPLGWFVNHGKIYWKDEWSGW